MRRTTLSLPDELVGMLKREARRRDTSVSQVAREVLEERFTSKRRPRKLGFIGIGRSGSPNTSNEIDEILKREWTPDRDR